MSYDASQNGHCNIPLMLCAARGLAISEQIRAHSRDSETCFAVLDHHAALRCNRAGGELCGCLATSSCLQSCTSQGKSRGHRRLQPGNGDECRPRRRPLRSLRPERGREARRAGARRRPMRRSLHAATPSTRRTQARLDAEQEALNERFRKESESDFAFMSVFGVVTRGRGVLGVCLRATRLRRGYVPNASVAQNTPSPRRTATTHAGRCRSSTSSTSRSRWTPRRSAPAGSTERRA